MERSGKDSGYELGYFRLHPQTGLLFSHIIQTADESKHVAKVDTVPCPKFVNVATELPDCVT